MTEQNNEFADAFDAAIADSSDSASKQSEFSADDVTEQTGNDTATPSEESASSVGQQNEPEDDPWLSVPEPLRNQYAQLQQQYQTLESNHRANSSRVAALNRKAEELQQQLTAREAQGVKPKDGEPTAADLKGKSLSQIREEWPDVADAIEQELQNIRNEFAPVKEILSEREQQRAIQQQQAALQDEFSQLKAAHPDANEIAGDPSFHQWVNTQPEHVQSLYASTSARDNAVLLQLYKSTPAFQQKSSANQSRNNLADHVATPRQGSGTPTATRRSSASFEDAFDFHVKHG